MQRRITGVFSRVGEGRRMGGADKGADAGGKPLIAYVVARLLRRW